MPKGKLAYVGSKKGELTLFLSPTEIMLGVELAMPGTAPFVIRNSLTETGAASTEILFIEMVKGLIALIQAYFEAQHVDQAIVQELVKRIHGAVYELTSEYVPSVVRDGDEGSGVLEQVRDIETEIMFEAEFEVPEGFLEEAHGKVVTANPAIIRRPPPFPHRDIHTGPQTKIVERPAPSLKNVIQKYRGQQNKPPTGELFVLVYDSCGRPVGVRSIKGPGWKGIGGGGKIAAQAEIEIPGAKEPVKVTLYTKPTHQEMEQALGDEGEARAFVFPTQDQVVVWNASAASFEEVAQNFLPAQADPNTAIPITLWAGGYVQVDAASRASKWFHDPKVATLLKTCSALTTALGTPLRQVYYFDEAAYGPWDEQREGITTEDRPMSGDKLSSLQRLQRVIVAKEAGRIIGVLRYADYEKERRIISMVTGDPGIGIESRLLAALGQGKPVTTPGAAATLRLQT